MPSSTSCQCEFQAQPSEERTSCSASNSRSSSCNALLLALTSFSLASAALRSWRARPVSLCASTSSPSVSSTKPAWMRHTFQPRIVLSPPERGRVYC
ncbi:hypothetical protein OH76DRAFT_358998 [Lentinus brumalis]|uniref:Uncharacterized protein n=1 Tax=Lentinus brumalis TaxID=2498619 RepID=A0A371CJE6_9APHY|nr:hypothetical protein OH76DRAFT_358998 [Polyporus brumalis]